MFFVTYEEKVKLAALKKGREYFDVIKKLVEIMPISDNSDAPVDWVVTVLEKSRLLAYLIIYYTVAFDRKITFYSRKDLKEALKEIDDKRSEYIFELWSTSEESAISLADERKHIVIFTEPVSCVWEICLVFEKNVTVYFSEETC